MPLHTILLSLALTICVHYAFALPLDQFYPFGSAEGDISMSKTDDGFDQMDLAMTFPYFDTNYDTIFISNNGLISFERAVSDYTGDPFPLSNGIRMIAGYWGDVDTRSDPQLLATVFYRETTNASILARATAEVNEKFPVRPAFEASQVIVVTYYKVGYFSAQYSARATFQIVLISDGTRSFTQLLYHELGWYGAQAGFNSGNSYNYFNLPGALTPQVTNLTFLSNVDIPGKFAFRIDSSSVQQGGCGSNFSLLFSPTSGPELGGIPISFFGPCFSNQSTILARFGTEETTCVWSSQVEVKCPLPFFIGQSFLPVNVWLSTNNGTTWQRSQSRFSYFSYDASLSTPVLRTNSSGYVTEDSLIEFEWEEMDGDSEQAELEIYQLQGSSSRKRFILPLLARIGQRIILQAVIRNARIVRWVDRLDRINDILGKLEEKDVDSIFFVVRLGHRYITSEMHLTRKFYDPEILCQAFVQADIEDGDQWKRDLPQCPLNLSPSPPAGWRTDRLCSRAGIWQRGRNFVRKFINSFNCDLNPGAVECWKTRVATRSGAHQQCCYNENGNLITSGLGAGTPDRGSSLVTHVAYDLLPSMFCGCFAGNAENCAKYQSRRPPSIGSADSSRWRPSTTFGDPHFVTLDGAPFSFNGVGEFVLLRSLPSVEIDNRFAVQIRTRAVSFNSYKASVINAVAVSAANGSKIGVYLSDRGLVNILIDNVQIEYAPTDIIAVGADSIEISTLNSSSSIRIDLSNSVAIDITSFGSSFGVVVSLPLSYRNNTEGLLGNWNGDKTDDFKSKEGAYIDIDASNDRIHYNFGLTWRVTTTDTLFFYPLGTSVQTFFNYYYTPTFTSPVFSNATFEAEARRICSESPIEDQCLFDAAVTNNLGVARESVTSFNGFATSLQNSNLGPQFRNTIGSLSGNQGVTIQHNFDVIDFEGDSYTLEIVRAPEGSSISQQGVFSWNVPSSWSTGTTQIDIVGRDARGNVGGVSFNVEISATPVTSSSNYVTFNAVALCTCVLFWL